MYCQRNYTICIFKVLHQVPSKQQEKMNFDYLNECCRIAKLDAWQNSSKGEENIQVAFFFKMCQLKNRWT